MQRSKNAAVSAMANSTLGEIGKSLSMVRSECGVCVFFLPCKPKNNNVDGQLVFWVAKDFGVRMATSPASDIFAMYGAPWDSVFVGIEAPLEPLYGPLWLLSCFYERSVDLNGFTRGQCLPCARRCWFHDDQLADAELVLPSMGLCFETNLRPPSLTGIITQHVC